MTNDVITKTVFFSAGRQTVWSFLTEKDKLAKWFHPAQADLCEGEDYALMEMQEDGTSVKVCWGSVLLWEPPVKLVYSFTIKPLNGAMTSVTWLLEEAHGGTRLTLVHEGIGEAADEAALTMLGALDAGWDAHLGRLRAMISQLQAA